ncbi:hypothetical protein K6T82_23955 [Flavobacterium sp. 17A]|uniref:Uncharacterized protein n=1 Tax=Flavobacterium potami TaxID=2872310 RepID=A0A9X1HEH3_9FLAO|nr:hypothetical protein [Flavobacterium potami]MBZ4037833.1 hypothetical protein [Flavobacterium potami]
MENDLEILFRKAASLQEEMRLIFKRNNLKSTQLKYLSKAEFDQWMNLHNESIILTKKISKLISQKA